MTICSAVQQRLAETGAVARELNAELDRHVAECADCTRFLENLRRVESAIGQMPLHDPADSLVADTLHAVRRAPPVGAETVRPSPGRRGLAGALAASVAIAAAFGLMQDLPTLPGGWDVYERQVAGSPNPREGVYSLHARQSVDRVRQSGNVVNLQGGQKKSEVAKSDNQHAARRLRLEESLADGESTREVDELARAPSEQVALLERNLAKSVPESEGAEVRTGSHWENKGLAGTDEDAAADAPVQDRKSTANRAYRDQLGTESRADLLVDRSSNEAPAKPAAPPFRQSRLKDENVPVGDKFGSVTIFRGLSSTKPDSSAPAPVRTAEADAEIRRIESSDKESFGDRIAVDQRAKRKRQNAEPTSAIVVGGTLRGAEPGAAGRRRSLSDALEPAETGRGPAGLLARFASLEGLSFQSPTGYWANTYIPGDPAIRLLEARLRAWDRATLGRPARLERAARQAGQPFDAPDNAALALYLHADTRHVQGPTRLRLQVGLKGARRQGGHRPAMNVALVVDHRALGDVAMAGRVRALIAAMRRARQPADRFSLTVTGPAGGMLVPAERFRHGPLSVAIDRLFASPAKSESGAVDLAAVIALAAESVRTDDRPGAVLGASLVLLATGAPFAQDLPELERIAHRNAVAGVALSVVRLGPATPLEQVDRLVAAGQGNRRFLDAADKADVVVDRELHAASRAVARAVRLRIRLAPGVKLIDILGSRRLDEPQAARVRQAEQATDRRLARNFGIRADRGEDEHGIQIVIPNFYADDAHVVLLDLVAEGPGPIADVTVRYKDVVYLRNGVAQAHLTIEPGARAAGPLERNVLKNLAAWELSRLARRIGRRLEGGQVEAAGSQLSELRDQVQGLRDGVAGWSADPDLVADQAMLDDYLAILRTPAAGDEIQRRYLADSLRYAAFRKLHSTAE